MVRDEVESRATTTEMNKKELTLPNSLESVLCFKIFGSSKNVRWTFFRQRMAHSSGFEPETYRLEIGCSIQLSYECMIG